MNNPFVPLNTDTKFLFSTSGSQSSITRHNEALQSLDINLVYFTIKDAVSPKVYADSLRAPFVRGGAVTAQNGLKSSIIPFLDQVEPLALKTKAVNTVVNRDGILFGYNTDIYGLQQALVKGLKESEIEIKTAVIYGNGGVSGVAFHILQEMGIRVTIVGRNDQKVKDKRKELGIESIPHFDGPYDLLVDATPISSTPDFLQAFKLDELLKGCKMVFCHNMPERDGKPNYLQAYCNELGIFFIPGSQMYSGQLVKQYGLILEGFRKKDGTHVSDEDILIHWKVA
jgi:shikimate dehydrogenase